MIVHSVIQTQNTSGKSLQTTRSIKVQEHSEFCSSLYSLKKKNIINFSVLILGNIFISSSDHQVVSVIFSQQPLTFCCHFATIILQSNSFSCQQNSFILYFLPVYSLTCGLMHFISQHVIVSQFLNVVYKFWSVQRV